MATTRSADAEERGARVSVFRPFWIESGTNLKIDKRLNHSNLNGKPAEDRGGRRRSTNTDRREQKAA